MTMNHMLYMMDKCGLHDPNFNVKKCTEYYGISRGRERVFDLCWSLVCLDGVLTNTNGLVNVPIGNIINDQDVMPQVNVVREREYCVLQHAEIKGLVINRSIQTTTTAKWSSGSFLRCWLGWLSWKRLWNNSQLGSMKVILFIIKRLHSANAHTHLAEFTHDWSCTDQEFIAAAGKVIPGKI